MKIEMGKETREREKDRQTDIIIWGFELVVITVFNNERVFSKHSQHRLVSRLIFSFRLLLS